MSNSSAIRKAATGRSDKAGIPAPHAAHHRTINIEELLHELREFYGLSGTDGPVTAICDMLNFSLEQDLYDNYRQNLVFDATRLIRLLVKVQSIIHA